VNGRDYYVRFYPFIKRKNYILVYFDSHKITVYIFIERLSKQLESYGWSKSFIVPFCADIKRKIKISLQEYVPKKKIPLTSSKSDTHLYKSKSRFRIGSVSKKTLQKDNRELEYLFFENLVRDIKGCKIVNKNSVRNLVKLRKLFPYLDNKYRFHEFRWVFSGLDIALLKVINYIIKFGTIRDKNITIWVNKNTSKKATSLIVSISSRANKELCNRELLKEGFDQIAERLLSQLSTEVVLQLYAKMYQNEVSVEFGNSSHKSKEFIEKLGFEFLPRTYKVYNDKYWLDCSHGGVELEFKTKTYLTNIYNVLSFVKEFKLYTKGIVPIEPFSLENINVESGISYETKGCYKNRDFNDLVSNQAVRCINRIIKYS